MDFSWIWALAIASTLWDFKFKEHIFTKDYIKQEFKTLSPLPALPSLVARGYGEENMSPNSCNCQSSPKPPPALVKAKVSDYEPKVLSCTHTTFRQSLHWSSSFHQGILAGSLGTALTRGMRIIQLCTGGSSKVRSSLHICASLKSSGFAWFLAEAIVSIWLWNQCLSHRSRLQSRNLKMQRVFILERGQVICMGLECLQLSCAHNTRVLNNTKNPQTLWVLSVLEKDSVGSSG